LQLSLKHADGKHTFVSVIVQANGDRYLRLTSSDKWAYRSLGGIFKSSAAALPISDQDFTTLRNLLYGKSDKVVALHAGSPGLSPKSHGVCAAVRTCGTTRSCTSRWMQVDVPLQASFPFASEL
jgi:hypothetical protein